MPEIAPTPVTKPSLPTYQPLADNTHLFDMHRGGIWRSDWYGFATGSQTGAPEGYAGLGDALSAAKQFVAPTSPSVAVIENGGAYGLTYLTEHQVDFATADWHYVPVQMPAMEPRDGLMHVHDALAAIITPNGALTRDQFGFGPHTLT